MGEEQHPRPTRRQEIIEKVSLCDTFSVQSVPCFHSIHTEEWKIWRRNWNAVQLRGSEQWKHGGSHSKRTGIAHFRKIALGGLCNFTNAIYPMDFTFLIVCRFHQNLHMWEELIRPSNGTQQGNCTLIGKKTCQKYVQYILPDNSLKSSILGRIKVSRNCKNPKWSKGQHDYECK